MNLQFAGNSIQPLNSLRSPVLCSLLWSVRCHACRGARLDLQIAFKFMSDQFIER